MQDQKLTFEEFSDRTDRLAAALGLPLNDLYPRMGISRDTFFGCRTGRTQLSRKTVRKLVTAETAAGIQIVQEPKAKYGNDLRNLRKQEEDPSSLKLNSAFRPPAAEPTAPQCVRYLTEYLNEVHHVPGSVGLVWSLLQLHLPLSQARLLREQHERSYPELYEHE